ncbi:PREDICTED: thymidine phosphorylase isoform X1 [Nanorana parkeri]|uniref:thymidine phosphorylase isoform X1 n=1 Tax=Nanorana parkeri TaxID=125878 RepID=UPI000853F9D3|nr:PREDICTED: thymidine phosphorylase isoform X1 [Nanorana parkeri]
MMEGCNDTFHFRISDIIAKKRNGLPLSSQEIRHVVKETMRGQVQDSQLGNQSALLMAIRLCGMNPEETMTLTKEMVASGCVLTWPEEWHGLLVDKHSTGGVGDKVSLPLAPALAACGCKVPMISGRGLGHTGGTLDKLESVLGFSSNQSPEQMLEILRSVGCCIVGQSANLVPADKILYEMRDVTATVDSLPLITASVMSKKVAESLSALILDVKFGEAAQSPTIEDARRLAHSLVTVGVSLGIPTIALITNMDNPIGNCIGNSLEVIEALKCLEGEGPEDLRELVTRTGGYLLCLCGQAVSESQGAEKIAKVLDDGSALQCFQKMMEAQGVQPDIARSLNSNSNLGKASHIEELVVQTTGTVELIRARPIAEILNALGAGRKKATDVINHRIGAELLVRVGQHVKKGSPWIRIHYEKPLLHDTQREALQNALCITDQPAFTPPSLIKDIIIYDDKKEEHDTTMHREEAFN